MEALEDDVVGLGEAHGEYAVDYTESKKTASFDLLDSFQVTRTDYP